jgi:antitoxin CptB
MSSANAEDRTEDRAEDRALDDLDLRRRRARIRAWRRGMREMDILLGGFVDARVDTLAPEDIDALEALLDAPDDAAYRWFSGADPVPPEHDTPLFAKIVAFHAHAGPIH